MSFSILGKCKELEEERPEFYEDLNLIPLIKEMQELTGEEDLSEFFYRMPDGIEQIRYRQEILQEMDEEMEQKLTDFVNRIRQAKKEEEYISSETGEQITDDIIRYILYSKEKGCFMTGTEDMTVSRINVVK